MVNIKVLALKVYLQRGEKRLELISVRTCHIIQEMKWGLDSGYQLAGSLAGQN